MEIHAIKTTTFSVRQDLFAFILSHVSKLEEGEVLVVTSKIVALAEGRTITEWNEKTKENIIKQESEFALETKYVWLTIKDGTVMASAGIDESNAEHGELILLPKDSFKSAMLIRKKLMQHFGITKLGVIITDSRLMPLRSGVVGVALGYAGFKGLRDYRGKTDMFGRKLKMTQTDIADGLATAAVLCMGEGNECQPLARIQHAPITFANRVNRNELIIAPQDDLYAPLFQSLSKSKKVR